jgi:hypothetical protein
MSAKFCVPGIVADRYSAAWREQAGERVLAACIEQPCGATMAKYLRKPALESRSELRYVAGTRSMVSDSWRPSNRTSARRGHCHS